MPVPYADLFLTQAANFSKTIVAKNDNGETMNLHGYTVASYAKRSYYTNRVTLDFTTTILDASNGIVKLTASAGDTANVGPGRLVYDVIAMSSALGDSQRILEGIIQVNPATTRGLKYGDYFYSYDAYAPAGNCHGNNNPGNIYTNNIYAANIVFANTDQFTSDVDGGIYQ